MCGGRQVMVIFSIHTIDFYVPGPVTSARQTITKYTLGTAVAVKIDQCCFTIGVWFPDVEAGVCGNTLIL